MPSAKLKVLVLWSPIRAPDNRSAAVQASAYLSDPRAEHFWDLWSFGLKTYTKQLGYPPGEAAWDIFVLYEDRVNWGQAPPQPALWLENRGLAFGTKYSQDLLRQGLEKLVAK